MNEGVSGTGNRTQGLTALEERRESYLMRASNVGHYTIPDVIMVADPVDEPKTPSPVMRTQQHTIEACLLPGGVELLVCLCMYTIPLIISSI